MAGTQDFVESVHIIGATAAGIDEKRAPLHASESVGVKQLLRVRGQGGMDGDNIGLREQISQRGKSDSGFFFNRFRDIGGGNYDNVTFAVFCKAHIDIDIKRFAALAVVSLFGK